VMSLTAPGAETLGTTPSPARGSIPPRQAA
jgi:hypothetical protein